MRRKAPESHAKSSVARHMHAERLHSMGMEEGKRHAKRGDSEAEFEREEAAERKAFKKAKKKRKGKKAKRHEGDEGDRREIVGGI